MKRQLSVLSLAVASVCLASQAQAVYNLYSKNGLTLDVNGEVGVMAYTKSNDIKALHKEGVIGTAFTGENLEYLASIAQGTTEAQTDKRIRLGEEPGSSWLEVRGSQRMNDDWRATGTIGLGYVARNATSSQGGAYLSTANVAIDKKDTGAVTVGRQFLHTAYVSRTDTYTPLETYGGQSIRLDYTGVPNLHASAYYNLPESRDIRRKGDDEVRGYGVSASYVYPINNKSSLRLAAGHSNSQKNPDTKIFGGNAIAANTQASVISAEYRYNNLLLAADVGRRNEAMKGLNVNDANTRHMGVKVGYALTPTLNVAVGYGNKELNRTYNKGSEITAQILNKNILDSRNNSLDFLFNKIEEKRIYAQADYYLRNNFRLYGRVDKYDTKTQVGQEDYAKIDTTEYRAGLSFLF